MNAHWHFSLITSWGACWELRLAILPPLQFSIDWRCQSLRDSMIAIVVLVMCNKGPFVQSVLSSSFCPPQNMSTFESELENLLGEFHIKMKGKIKILLRKTHSYIDTDIERTTSLLFWMFWLKAYYSEHVHSPIKSKKPKLKMTIVGNWTSMLSLWIKKSAKVTELVVTHIMLVSSFVPLE